MPLISNEKEESCSTCAMQAQMESTATALLILNIMIQKVHRQKVIL